MAENDKKPLRKQAHVSDGVGKLSKQNFNKGTPSISQKLGVTPRGRRLNLKQLSTMVKEEKNCDESTDAAKSPKTPGNKRGSLKMNKSKKQNVSPYTTRSLSSSAFLRNGKRKNNINLLELQRKYIRKRVIPGDTNTTATTAIEDGKSRIKRRKSPSPELRPTKIKKRHVSEEDTVPPITKCSMKQESVKSGISPEVVKVEEDTVPPITKCSMKQESVESGISQEIVNDGDATDDKISLDDISLGSFPDTQVSEDIKENLNRLNNSIEEECSVHVSEVSVDKSSFFTLLSDSKYEHSKTEVISCKDDLISEKGISNSCDTIFDLSKCLKPVIDITKVQDNEDGLEDVSEDSFPEELYLSESPRSFEGEGEHLQNLSKSHFEADTCTLNTSSGILSTENSQSSVIMCSSSEGNFLSSTNLPQCETNESKSENTTHNSVSVPNSEESMNQLIDNIRSVKMHVNYDSNHIDTATVLEKHVQTDACLGNDTLESQEVGASSDDFVAEEKEKMESAKDFEGISVVSVLEAKEDCIYNINSFNNSERLIENGNKSVSVVGDPVEINYNSTESVECHILSQDSSKSFNGEENIQLQQKMRSSLADIVKKGLLTLPKPETGTISNEEEIREEPDDKVIVLSDSDSSMTSPEKCDENEEFFRDGAISPEKSCLSIHKNECDVNENIERALEETEIIECQVNESHVALETSFEEKVMECNESSSISVNEHCHADHVILSAGEENCNQKESEDVTNSSEAENIGKESSTEAAVSIVEDSEEQLAIKETILNALGLQSSRAASLNKSTVRQGLPPIPSRTSGTLKTIIKVPRMADKRRARNRFKLVLKNDKPGLEKEMGGQIQNRNFVGGGDKACHSRQPESVSPSQQAAQDPLAYRIFNDASMSTVEPWGTHLSKQKSKSQMDLSRLHYSRSSLNGLNTSSSIDCQSKLNQDSDQNIHSDGSSNSARSSQQGTTEGTGEPSLVIPEKSSSFSIHPERLCHDVCCYCFGKFGSLDTPMHLAQMKGEDKRRTALSLEAHLTLDSCLCDACYRYLDRKASCPSYQPYRRQSGMSGGILTKPQVCCVRGCSLPAHHLVRRKWLTRLKRSISKLLPLELNPLPTHQQTPLHAPLCSRHFYCLEYYSMCGICKRKLSRNNMHPVGREVHALNSVLLDDSIPVTLTGKIFLCKMCRYYSGIRLKYRDKKMLSTGHKTFFDSYRKRIWHYLGIQTLDNSEISAPMEIPKKRKKSKSADADPSKNTEQGKQQQKQTEGVLSHPPETTSDSSSETCVNKSSSSTMLTKIRFKLGNVSIEQLDNIDLNKKDPKGQVSQTVNQSGSQRKSESTKPKKKSTANSAVKNSGFPGVEQLGLNASFVFHGNSDEKNKEWEKCTTTIQFDSKTKKLWQNLYYPYGNFSSFIRHLVIMERNWRTGDLILAPNASTQAVNYVNSVQNRIAAYEGSSSWPSTKTTLSKPSSTVQSSSQIAPSKPVSVPQKPTKETPQLLPMTAMPRINLTSAQLRQCSTPVAAQLIPVNPTNFLPISCAPNQFISLGSPGSFIQIGGPPGLVHQLNTTYPCVQLDQEVVPEKDLAKADEISGPELPVVSGPSSSSSSTFDLHISNVRSLAEDGNGSCWEQQSERQLLADKDLIASSTYDSDKTEESQMQDIAIIPVAPLAVVSTPQTVEIGDNHTYSDEAVGRQSAEKS